MTYLLLAILSSALVSIAMRLSTSRIQNNMTMFMANYFICILLSALFGARTQPALLAEGAGFAALIGVISGIMYLAAFMLLQLNIRQNGVVLSATFMKLGVLVPTIMAVVLYREKPGFLSVLGIVIAAAAIICINLDGSQITAGKPQHLWLLFILLLAGGFTDSLANIYEKGGSPACKDFYLLCTFAVAFLLSAAIKQLKKQRFTLADTLWGALIGIPNYFSSRFLLLSLSQLQATIAYPVYNIGAIALVTAAGILFFKEHLSRQKWIAMGLILLALVLLNV